MIEVGMCKHVCKELIRIETVRINISQGHVIIQIQTHQRVDEVDHNINDQKVFYNWCYPCKHAFLFKEGIDI